MTNLASIPPFELTVSLVYALWINNYSVPHGLSNLDKDYKNYSNSSSPWPRSTVILDLSDIYD